MVFWEGYLSDETMGIISPVVVYWLYAGFYHILPPLDNYRLHTRKEEAKNVVPIPTVIKGVLLQQSIQATVAYLLFWVNNSMLRSSEVEVQPSFPIQLLQFIVAMLVTDAWQYFGHRYLHQNKFLYKHIHSLHHKMVVPYAFGTFYNHPLEGLFLDTFGGVASMLISGMTARTSVFFFSFSIIKAIDDHSGLWLPGYNLFHLFPSNPAYHDIHHYGGIKYNYAQPFFTFWDKLYGTHMPYTVVKRPGGGFEVRPLNHNKASAISG
ncbi:hypothetical protein C5167_044099 [Papaver somniferum]|uniref:Fatty acid hydroxylase domain-containing protein n=1 Tax=Papaver somniferum TaxID=3469 RepID=A0A4Y7LBF2_PAPSO|nr:sphinganine C4-monooxygenase 1-like [Papaver somniferum]RZC81525.1 hypothetical protein C5167_044099 [Papaver somniferum]